MTNLTPSNGNELNGNANPDLRGFVPIPGYERYLINPDGRIYSTIRKGRFVRFALNNQGYPYATLMKTGARKGKKVTAHRLMADTFLPNPEGRETVNHLNGNRLDFRKSNLEWATQKENNDHARETGANPDHGETHHNARLKEAQVREIRQLLAEKKLFHREIAEKFGINRKHVTKIASGKLWRRVA